MVERDVERELREGEIESVESERSAGKIFSRLSTRGEGMRQGLQVGWAVIRTTLELRQASYNIGFSDISGTNANYP